MTLYSISNWNENYENNRSRLVKEIKWVPIPNSHDGEAYSNLMSRKDAAIMFSAWILMLQVASRCEPRGDLVKTSGQPHDSASLSMRTRVPAVWFDKAFPVLVEIGWLSRKDVIANDTALGRQEGAPQTSGGCALTVTEEKRREGMEEKGKNGMEDGRAAGAAATSDADWIAGLKANPAYSGIDVDREILKAKAWADVKRRKCSRPFLINWLNRAERPISGGQSDFANKF